MSWDSASDELITALSAVVRARVNAALLPTLGSDFLAVDTVFVHPVTLELVVASRMPALAVWRRKRTYTARGRRLNRLDEVRFDYFAPPTPISKLPSRWRLLEPVWNEVLAAALSGVDPSTEENLLCAAGVQEVVPYTPTCDFDFAEDDQGNSYPAFQGTIWIEWTPPVARAGVAFRELMARYYLKNPDHAPAIVEQLITRTGFSSAFDEGYGI